MSMQMSIEAKMQISVKLAMLIRYKIRKQSEAGRESLDDFFPEGVDASEMHHWVRLIDHSIKWKQISFPDAGVPILCSHFGRAFLPLLNFADHEDETFVGSEPALQKIYPFELIPPKM